MSLLFGMSISTQAMLPASAIPLSQWEAQKGDRMIVDTQENIGYLVHEDGSYASITVGSGRREMVRYAGRRYNATTPIGKWTVLSKHVQSDKNTFGKSGRFLRLYFNGKDRTLYGIHSTANIKQILSGDDRYKSFGCILVDDSVMDILYETYELNGEQLEVVTTYGLNENLLAAS